jgi:hypothetical protein
METQNAKAAHQAELDGRPGAARDRTDEIDQELVGMRWKLTVDFKPGK